MNKFPLTNMAVKMFCPDNVVQLDDAGLPSLLVYIPKFKLSDVLNTDDNSTHPAFIVNGTEIPGFYYSKYQNVVYNGKAYSLPAEDPAANVKFEKSMECCEAKGYGWHLSTNAEWAAIALWCKLNGFLPYGNNNYGKDSRESNYKAIPTSYTSGKEVAKVATGTGPLTWSHDKTMGGIWDMNGNGFEWQGGFRLVWGELQVLANNDAADPNNPQNETSTCWKAINATDGSLIEPESKTTDTAAKSSGSTIKVDYVNNVWTYSTNILNPSSDSKSCPFSGILCDDTVSEAAKVLLRALALLPDEGTTTSEYEGDYVAWNNGSPERGILRGGAWTSNTRAGVFGFDCGYSKNATYENITFRASYIPNI